MAAWPQPTTKCRGCALPFFSMQGQAAMAYGIDGLLAAAGPQLLALQAAAEQHPWQLCFAFICFHAVVFFGSQVG